MEKAAKKLSVPLSDDSLQQLRCGDVVYLDGLIFTGRIRFYKKVVDQGVDPPIDLAKHCNVNFHCSPAVRREESGKFHISAVTGTASFRFVQYLEPMFAKHGVKAIIGKGGMKPDVYRGVFQKYGAIYLLTVGYGLGALYGRAIVKVEDVHWLSEMGLAQAMWVIRVKDFGPLIVDYDLSGTCLQEQMGEATKHSLGSLLAGYSPATLKRYGEVDSSIDQVL
jgi:L(+)-tartrate dehydratase beta subunit